MIVKIHATIAFIVPDEKLPVADDATLKRALETASAKKIQAGFEGALVLTTAHFTREGKGPTNEG